MESTRERIIGAARDEFSRVGYRSASTNRIVSAAGVSKGLLFSYFGTKKELYLTILMMELAGFVHTVAADDLTGHDPIDRFEQMVGATFAYYNAHRTAFALMLTSTDIDRPLQDELLKRLSAARLPDLIDRVLEGVDYSRLVHAEAELRQVLSLMLNGIKQTISTNVRVQTSAKALERIFRAELALITRVLRQGIYRGGVS